MVLRLTALKLKRSPVRGDRNGHPNHARPGGNRRAAIIRKAICCSGLPAIVRQARHHEAIIVAYHGVIPDHLWQGWITADMIPLSLFRQHLQFYRKHYNVMPLRQMVEGLSGDGRHLPSRSLAITFDDGYRNNLLYAMPALVDEQMTAAFMLTSGFIDRTMRLWWLRLKKVFASALRRGRGVRLLPDLFLPTDEPGRAHLSYKQALALLKTMPSLERDAMLDRLESDCPPETDEDSALIFEPMSWDDVADLHRNQMEIGAHTVSHPILAQETTLAATNEVVISADRVRQHIPVNEMAFSYPNGQWADFTVTMEAAVRDAGCYCALSSVPGTNSAGDNPYALRRLPISGLHSLAAVELDTCRLNDIVRRAGRLLAKGRPNGASNLRQSTEALLAADEPNPQNLTGAHSLGRGQSIVWGEEIDGLRLGLGIEPGWPDEPPRKTLGAILHVENRSAQWVTLGDRVIGQQQLPRLVNFTLSAQSESGQRISLLDALPLARSTGRKIQLAAGQARPLGVVLLKAAADQSLNADMDSGDGAVCLLIQPCVQAGQRLPAEDFEVSSGGHGRLAMGDGRLVSYSISASYRFDETKKSAGWSGTLVSGQVRVQLLAPPAGAGLPVK